MYRRNQRHRSFPTDSQVDYLGTVSDLMSGLLFVFILALMTVIFFMNRATRRATQAEKEAKSNAASLQGLQGELRYLQRRLTGAEMAREGLIERVTRKLHDRKVYVIADFSRGVLRIPETAVSFNVGSARLDSYNEQKLRVMSKILERELFCFSAANVEDPRCVTINPKGYKIDAVFIEGHTDNQQYWGDTTGRRNRELATSRSNAVYDILVRENPILYRMQNSRQESIFSLSGYGDMRPVEGHVHTRPTNDRTNRRIRLRFLLRAPKFEKEDQDTMEVSKALAEQIKTKGRQ